MIRPLRVQQTIHTMQRHNNVQNVTGGDGTDPSNTAWTTGGSLSTQLGSSGLAGWIPAVIAVAIGALFLSYFMSKEQ